MIGRKKGPRYAGKGFYAHRRKEQDKERRGEGKKEGKKFVVDVQRKRAEVDVWAG